MKWFLLLLITLFLPPAARSQAPVTLVPQPISLKKTGPFYLHVPRGYRIAVAAEGLNRPRFFSKSPDGKLFITDMYDRSDNKKGKVLVLENWNDSSKQFGKVSTYLSNLHNPNQVAFYTRGDRHYIYVAETGQLSYYPYVPGETTPSATPTVIARFPDYGLSYKYGGWHLTRSIVIRKDKLYVSVGSSCDACIEKEEIRASIVEMDPDGGQFRFVARGLRNAVGMKWVEDVLWVTNMGRDNRGPDQPEEQLLQIIPGSFYGWPYYYQYRKKVITDPAFKDSLKPAWVRKPPISQWGIRAHSAPLGLEYIQGFSDSLLNGSFLVALHGSTSVWRQRGNAVVQMLPRGGYREIVTGFLQGKTEDKRYGRPCDVLQWDDRSFFISDDKNGVIYYVWKEE